MRNYLRNLRLQKKYTQTEIAKLIGISQRHYSDIERGKSDPSWAVAQRFEQLFNIPAGELLAESGEDA